jgi:hypothetical protein
MIGEHVVTVTGVAGGPPADISCLVDQVKVTHGRDTADGQPVASTASLDLSFTTTTDDLPPEADIGATLVVTTVLDDDSEHIRFTGDITDLVAGWEDTGPDTPNSAIMQILAAGPLAGLGRRVVGDTPWPQELDGARVKRVLTAAAVTTNPAHMDPGQVQILPRDIDPKAALGLAQEPADSALGILWETKAGEIRYADAEHRRGATPTLALDACDIEVTPTWRRDTQGLINGVSIGYGVAPEGGEQPRFVTSDTASQAAYGRAEYSVGTVLADFNGASSLGLMLMTRNSDPVWLLQELPVGVAELDTPTTAALLDLDVHDLLSVTGMPVLGSLPSSAYLWVEGFTETLTGGGHELALYVSGFCRTAPSPRWEDVPTTLVWDTVPPSVTWDSWTCLGVGGFPDEGRWADVPASTRWDMVPPSVTWNTWTSEAA